MTRILLLFTVFILSMPVPVFPNTDFEMLSIQPYENKRLTVNMVAGRKLSETELKAAAIQIYRENQGAIYARVFILWFLPGMKLDAGAWATTHFQPTLKIDIMDWMLEYNPTTLRN